MISSFKDTEEEAESVIFYHLFACVIICGVDVLGILYLPEQIYFILLMAEILRILL